MSLSAPSSPLPAECDEETPEELLISQHLQQYIDSVPSSVDDDALFEAAALHVSSALQRTFTADDIRQHVSAARSKRKRRKATESGAKRRHKQREEERKKYQEKLEVRFTRGRAEAMERTAGPEPAPLPSIPRSASTTTAHACSLLDSLDLLAARSKPPPAKKKRKEGNESVSGQSPAARRPLGDLSNQQRPPALDSIHPSVDSAPNTPVVSPASSNSSVASAAPPASQSASHSVGLMSIPARLNAKQQKRDLKKELAQATAEQVHDEMAERRKRAVMVDEATTLLRHMNKTMPALDLLVRHHVKKLRLEEEVPSDTEQQ